MKEENIPDLNIFMMCDELNKEALSDIPNGFHIRYCRKDELDIWKEFPFDNDSDKNEYKEYMTNYFNDVYAPNEELFYKSCLFLCDTNDKPIATCFAWKSYDSVYTIHWLKVLKGYEGMGLGRAILSEVMRNIPNEEYPVYLHTQPGSFRAIKLYSDFGFNILVDDYIGNRKNDYDESLFYLKYFMGIDKFSKLNYVKSDGNLSNIASKSQINQF